MMYAEPLFPEGHHPHRSEYYAHGGHLKAPFLRRSDVDMLYYLVDFGLSNRFEDRKGRLPLQSPMGQDKTAPELKSGEATDGFALDVYCLGNMTKRLFMGVSLLRVVREFSD